MLDLTTEIEALEKKTDPLLGRLRGTPKKVADLIRDYRTKGAAVLGRWDLPDDTKSKGRDLVRANSVKALQSLQDDVDKAVQEAQEELNRARRKRLQGDTAVELRMASAWQRAKGLLDTTQGDPMTAAQRLVERANDREDHDTLRALRRELPDYLEAKGAPLDAALERWLDLKTGDDTVRFTIVRLVEIERGLPRLQNALSAAKVEIEGGLPAPVIPDWKPGDGPNTDGDLIELPDAPDTVHPNDWSPSLAADARSQAKRTRGLGGD
jgi:hypothetical protein